jgi:uncharacterized YigZ family protein
MNILLHTSEGIFKEKGSKFLSFAFPVKDEEEIKQILTEYRKKHFNARHVCYAYMLGNERTNFRANDDGEPSGTAGRPILGQINSFDLTDVLIIVVRYFGGILLGTGGLVTAYKEAAANALINGMIEEKIITESLTIRFDYPLMNEITRIVKEFDLKIHTQKFEIDCELSFQIPSTQYEEVKGRFEKIYGVDF